MSKRKPLPRAAVDHIDRARTEQAQALEDVRAACKTVNLQELYRRLASVVDHLHRAGAELSEIEREHEQEPTK